jgi:hypothetical protein
MELLSELADLEELNADQCPEITDFGVEALSELRKLKHLALSGAMLTDRGVKALASINSLVGLSLPPNTVMSDQTLMQLAELPDLNFLTLPNCSGLLLRLLRRGGISRGGLARFQQAKPDCQVQSPELIATWRKRIDDAMKQNA